MKIKVKMKKIKRMKKKNKNKKLFRINSFIYELLIEYNYIILFVNNENLEYIQLYILYLLLFLDNYHKKIIIYEFILELVIY